MKKLALVGFRRGRTMTPEQVRKFREKHFKSREEMAKEFRTTARTIRAYESGENKSIPGIFVKAVELWLENRNYELSENQVSMYQNDPDIHKIVNSFINTLISSYSEVADDIIHLVKVKHREEIEQIIDGMNDSHKHRDEC